MSSTNNYGSNVPIALAVAAITLLWTGAIGFVMGVQIAKSSQPIVTKKSKSEKKKHDNSMRTRETSVTSAEDVKLMDKQALVDVRIAEIRPLLPPACILEEIPRTVNIAVTVNKGRQGVANILRRVDDRLVVVVGPCSIHDVQAALDYGNEHVIIDCNDDVN